MEELSRTSALIGESNVQKLKEKKVIVLGVGGVGGYVCEALARTGVGQIDLVDSDKISLSNINRQIIALHSTVGQKKVEVMKSRIGDINKNIVVNAFDKFITKDNLDEFNLKNYDYVIDAIDTVSSKIAIAELCYNEGINVISSMGAGNKLNPCAFKVADIYKTTVCPLARAVRTELKKRGVKKLKVVYSDETPVALPQIDEEGKRVPSSIAFIPSVAGLIIAAEVIKDLTK
ncbi:MAG: tRNA threonylcarbamoyladenosine dehydratase [Clostridia bacterium]|nr:tRNA threonylcarbamoyladenosine dehydratase [Clostridia bacterium]